MLGIDGEYTPQTVVHSPEELLYLYEWKLQTQGQGL